MDPNWTLGDCKSLKLAERVGFEPTIPVKVYTLSKRAPSATRPSLRLGKVIQAGCGYFNAACVRSRKPAATAIQLTSRAQQGGPTDTRKSWDIHSESMDVCRVPSRSLRESVGMFANVEPTSLPRRKSAAPDSSAFRFLRWREAGLQASQYELLRHQESSAAGRASRCRRLRHRF